MKNILVRKVLLVALCCLSLTGCGGNEAENAQTTVTQVTQEDAAALSLAATKEKYKELATENILLTQKRNALGIQCTEYASQVLNQSVEKFKNGAKGLQLAPEETEIVEVAETSEEDSQDTQEQKSQEEVTIPEVDDSQVENRVKELLEENELLKQTITELEAEVEMYKTQYGL